MTPDVATVPDLLRLMWRRKFLVLLAGLATGAIALGIAAALPPRFVSEGLLLVGTREPQIPELNVLAAPPPPESASSRTELDVLRSRALIEAVVRQLDLADNPEFAAGASPPRLRRAVTHLMGATANAIGGSLGARLTALFPPPPVTSPGLPERTGAAVDLVRKHLQVTHEDNSGVVAVQFTAGSAAVAAAVINTLFDRYIASEVMARRYVMQQTHRWLAERAAALRPEVEAADRAVQQFRNANPSFEVAQGSLTALELNSAETELSAARQELVRQKSALEAARGTDFKEALGSPMLQQLRDREADARQHLALIARLGVRHPEYIAAANNLQEVRREIAAATGKVVAAMQQDVADAARHVTDLETRVSASQALAERSATVAIGLSELTRDADAKRRVYETFMTRAAETEPTSAQFPSARVVSPAVPPQDPDRLPLSVVGGFGALAGAFAVAAVSILGFLQRQGIGSVRELATVTDLPCLGALPVLRRGRRGAATALRDDNRDATIETLRAMRFAIQAMAQVRDGGATMVLVTSSEVGDGKTTLAASFARLCAADGQRVLLVEADLRRPQLARTLGLEPTRNLEATLAGRPPFAGAVSVDRESGLHCLTAAGRAANPQKLFHSAGFATLLQRARRDYDLVVLDSPPVLRVADPLVIAGLCDVILFVVRWDRTPRALVTEGLRRIIPEQPSGRVATVLTQVPVDRLGETDYYAGYQTASLPGPRALALLPLGREAEAEKSMDGGLT